MREFFRHVLTGKDNKTYEIARVLMFAGFLCFIAFAGYDLYCGHPFDPIGFSGGLTGILFGGSGGIAVKANAEPGADDDRSS